MAHKIGNVNPDDINLLKVNLLKLDVDASEKYINSPLESSGLKIEMGHNIAFDFNGNAARYRLFFNFISVNDDQEDIGLSAEIALEFHFKIDNIQHYVETKKNQKNVGLPLAASLMNISYATSRGIILEKTQNTFFNGIILPIIDSTKFLLDL